LTYDEALQAVKEAEAIHMFAEKLTAGPVENADGIEVQDYIKRVIGLPGDVVEVRDGIIYVNGEPLQENFTTRPPNYMQYGPILVPPGEVFVLGDNRSNSQDSHVIGPVPLRNIEGRAELVFWPPARIGLIPQGK
jgi:signal peptidase I